ncbi:MAG: S8 family serine peptidase [Ignavibacteria bacterium]|nr:S8 family serine peptidase [Ignavibacteria bacterium]
MLELRTDGKRIGIAMKQDASLTEAKSVLSGYIGGADKLRRLEGNFFVLEFSGRKSDEETGWLMNKISGTESGVKFMVNSFAGTSEKVYCIPSDRLIVKLRSESDRAKLETMNAEFGCYITGNVNGPLGFLLRTNPENSLTTVELTQLYASRGIFEYVQPDFIYPDANLLLSLPNDQYFSSQWPLNNTGQSIQTGSVFQTYGDAAAVNGLPDADIDAVEAWNITAGVPSVKIAVIDSGIDSAHTEFQEPGHLLTGFDAYNNRDGSSQDHANHGTSVAGLIGALQGNGIGISGIAPGCAIMSVCIYDVNGTTSTSVITRAFDTSVARGADVINASWGGGLPEPAITNAVNNAAISGRGGLGCAVVFPSGNDSRNPPVYPSTLPNVICAGSSTPHDQKKSPGTGNQFYWGTNYGEDLTGDLDIIAPTNCYSLAVDGYQPNFTGSSASAAYVSGAAALVLSVAPSLSRNSVYGNILRSCDKPDNVYYSSQKTYGRWNPYYGYGRLNVNAAVSLAAGIDAAPPVISHRNVSSHSSTYATVITADVTDHDGSPVPATGPQSPKIHYMIKKGTGTWSAFDSAYSYSNAGNTFYFRIPSLGWESEVRYYISASDNSGNRACFPLHSKNSQYYCFFAVGNITSESAKLPAFTGADYGGTVSPAVNFNAFTILDAKFRINMRHTSLGYESFQIYAPSADPNNNRKCLFANNGGSGDNIYGAYVTDSASQFWSQGTPPYLNGSFKPDYSLAGLRGMNAGGAWRMIHFDGGITDYAFFDSVRIILYRTTGAKSPCARLSSPSDSILYFENSAFPGTYEKDFYLKNSGTTAMSVSSHSIAGQQSAMYSVVNNPPASISAGDSGLFRLRLNTAVGSSAVSQATLNIGTNDPSKPVFKVSLQTNDSLRTGLKNLQLTALVQGLYNPVTNVSIRDTLTVLLRRFNSPYALVDSADAYMTASGTGSFDFRNAQTGVSYYIVVRHRNGLETWSSAPVVFSGIQASYNFTLSASSAYGENLVLRGNKYCIYSGDINFDFQIDGADVVSADNAASNYSNGYIPQDINGDGFVDATDVEITHNNSEEYVGVIRP